MAEKGRFESAEEKAVNAYKRFGVIGLVATLFALIATIVSVVVLLPSEKTEITVQILACDELTKYSPVAELKGNFTYLGEEVAHLWKLKVNFVNSGDKTVVGEGSQKNILSEGLNFVFPDGTRILRIEDEDETFPSTVVKQNENHIQINFRQWRAGECTIASFYVASDKPLAVAPLPTIPTRDIIDGEVLIEDLTEKKPLEQMAIIDRLPRAISLAGKIMGGIVVGLLAIVIFIIVPWGWMDSVPMILWKRRNLVSFTDYLESIEPALTAYKKKSYKDNPYMLPKKLRANFDGAKIPYAPMFDSIIGGVFITVMLLAVAFGLISLILTLFSM